MAIRCRVNCLASAIIYRVLELTVQPIVNSSTKNTQGYKLGNTPIITTPFADDFNLISNNNVKHRKLVADIESKATCDLSFKPNKCRSLSLVSGKPTDIVFYLSTQTPINSVITHPHKFLGSSITRPHAHQVTTYHT